MRIVCLILPDFAVWTRRRHDPTLRTTPLIVGAVPPERGYVASVSPEARSAGVRRGMTSSQAQAVLPDARFVPPDAHLDQREEHFLLELLRTLTPGVEHRAEDDAKVFFLDSQGLHKIHKTETIFARRARDLVRDHGHPATAGIASSKHLARIAARVAGDPSTELRAGDIVRVATGGEAVFLRPLPLAHLIDDDHLLAEIQALGITTIGAWADLPAASIASRFACPELRRRGRDAGALHALARGDDPEPFDATPPAQPIEAAIDLDTGCTDLDLLTFHLKRAAETLCGRLASRGLAAATVRLTLDLDDHTRIAREATFPRPTVAPRLILDCLRLTLARDALTSPVRSCLLAVIDVVPARAEQMQLFARREAHRDPAAIEQALARVRALLGPDGVVSPHPADSHRPEEQIRWEPYAGIAEPLSGRKPRRRSTGANEPVLSSVEGPPPRLPRPHPDAALPPGPALRALPARVLPAPVAAQVHHGRDHLPTFLAVGHVRGVVTTADGPHRIEGAWWGDPYARDYFTVTLGGRARYWIYRDRHHDGWFLHGWFD